MGRELQGQGELPRLVMPVALTGADPTESSTHSLRRTKTALIYHLMRTKNRRALQLFLGHRKIESTVSYLGVDVMAGRPTLSAGVVKSRCWDQPVTADRPRSVRCRSMGGAGRGGAPGGFPQCLTSQGLITLSPAAWKGATSRVATSKP